MPKKPEHESQRRLRTWDGGFVRLSRGKEVFVIERRVGGGTRKKIALDAETEKEALRELALFERDPLNYRTKKQHQVDGYTGPGFRLDDTTLAEFLADAKARVDKGQLSDGWVKHSLANYLGAWTTALGGRELRRVSLEELNTLLSKWDTAQRQRVVTLKSLTEWARSTGRLKSHDDPTLEFKIPPVVAEKSLRQKGYDVALIEQTYAELPSQVLRDTLRLRIMVGMHDTEIGRIAGGKAVIRRLDDPSGIAGTVTFRHLKAGKVHVVSVDAATLAAAERLHARGKPLSRNAAKIMLDRAAIRAHGCGGVTTMRVNKKGDKVWETKACDECKPLQPGELRHSFATIARRQGRLVHPKKQKGVPLAEVAAVMGHLNPRTTKIFYEGNEVPSMVALPIKLEHDEDPEVPKQRKK